MKIISREDAKRSGQKRYFLGVPCVRGHVAERQVSSRRCLECHRIGFAERYASDPGGRKAYLQKWRGENRDRLKRYYDENAEYERARRLRRHYANPEEARRYSRERNERHPGLNALNSRKRILAERQRKVPWADNDKIKAVYREARRLTRETGTQYHVDHVIPLRGELASGLHVETNLRIVPAAENLRKSNKLHAE